MSLAAGSRVGPYEIRSLLGAGGMGQVWRAHDTRLERDVALKVLPAEALGDDTARARLIREARLASKLNHSHICTIYDVGEAEGQTYIAMELVEGQPLSARVADSALPVEQILRYGQQMAEALAHAHGRGVVHRDFKSANVVLTPDGQVKVLDFGLAKRLTEERYLGAGNRPLRAGGREAAVSRADGIRADRGDPDAIGATFPVMPPGTVGRRDQAVPGERARRAVPRGQRGASGGSTSSKAARCGRGAASGSRRS